MPDIASRPTILIVEDEFLIRLSLSETLADDGFAVLEAETVGKAIAHLSGEHHISLLVTDVQLEREGDGFRLGKTAREMMPALPVVYMTGRPGSGQGTLAPSETMIAKPFLPSELSALARRLLAGG